jgi:hypothetical protein
MRRNLHCRRRRAKLEVYLRLVGADFAFKRFKKA